MRLPLNFKFRKGKAIHERTAELPTSWGDLTLGQAIELNKFDFTIKNAKLKALAIITGLPVDELKALKEWNLFDECISFIHQEPNIKAFSIPNELIIGGKAYKVPKNLEIETYGQKVAIEELLRNAAIDNGGDIEVIPLMPEALAIYFYPMITGEIFKDEDVEQHIEKMLDIPVKHALPVAGFFLRKYGGLSLTSEPTLVAN